MKRVYVGSKRKIIKNCFGSKIKSQTSPIGERVNVLIVVKLIRLGLVAKLKLKE